MPDISFAESPVSPSSNCYAITPSDTAALPLVTKGIYVGTGGDIVLRSYRGEADVIFKNVPSGGIIDVRASQIKATGTTAQDLVGMA